MADASVLGRIVWYELLTTDMKAAEQFYTAVVGWTVAPFDKSPHKYDHFLRPGGVPAAGVMTIPPGMNFPAHWGMYIAVPKFDEGVAKVTRLGGSVLGPVLEIPNVGRMQTLKDPQGAAFSIIEPFPSENPPEAEAQIGQVSWHELYTTDAEAALKFYTEMFGWRPTHTMDMGPMGKYYMFGRSFDLGGMMNKPQAMANVPPAWTFYVRVPDVHEGSERIKANGGMVTNGPMEVPGDQWTVNAMDPQGAVFALHHRK